MKSYQAPEEAAERRRSKSNAQGLWLILFIFAFLAAMVWLEFHVWRLQHPQAPGWTYLFLRR